MKYIVAIFSIIFFLISSKPVWAKAPPAHTLIINQVRGEECCSKGVFQHLQMQVDAHIKNKIPAYFVVRYDALKDTKYINYFKEITSRYPQIIHVGLLLEVTPELAKAADVVYHAPKDKWYEAQNIFSIGYSYEENKKIADTLFNAFYSSFGYYPELTSSWMIESKFLQYLYTQYGVKVHQITREQWGTDSYTLYGGPPHYPYPSSEKWVFIPDYQRNEGPLIVRQTVADPLFNYGDTTNAFTSQPNDYANDFKKFEYFELLVKQAMIEQPQQQTGFALLGLENSMDSVYQDEFVKQIDHIKKYKDDDSAIFPDIDTLVTFWKNNPISVYWGKDLVTVTSNEVFWITTPGYRIRLRKNADRFYITDIRVFSTQYTDPYSEKQSQKEGFWIVPYLIDGSLTYKSTIPTPTPEGYNPLPKAINQFTVPLNDLTSDANRIELPPIKKDTRPQINFQDDGLHIDYQNQQDKNIQIIFGKEQITTKGLQLRDFFYKNSVPNNFPVQYSQSSNNKKLAWQIDNNNGVEMNINCDGIDCSVKFTAKPQLLTLMRTQQYPYIFPEPVARPLDKEKTVLYVPNHYVQIDKLPLKVVVYPYDRFGLITTLKDKIQVKTEKQVSYKLYLKDRLYHLDFASDKPLASKIKLQLANNFTKETTIYFAPNCKTNIKSCLNPVHAWWYVNSVIRVKLNQYLNRL